MAQLGLSFNLLKKNSELLARSLLLVCFRLFSWSLIGILVQFLSHSGLGRGRIPGPTSCSDREAVSCQYCNEFFHKRHAKKSGGTAECTYSCHRCLDEMHANSNSTRRKLDSKPANIQPQRGRKSTSVGRGRPVKHKGSKKPLSKRLQGKSQTNKKVPSSIPLRRSARKAKCLYVQKKRNVGRRKGKSKSKKVTMASRKPKETTTRFKMPVTKETTSRSKMGVTKETNSHYKTVVTEETTTHSETVFTFERKKRTHICYSYWLNGLRLSTKPNDERVMLFKDKRHLAPPEGFSCTFDQPKCHLCCGDGRTLNYIACEICGEWFHGDAFGLTPENARQLVGFRCHVCRDRIAPICPHKTSNALTHAEIKAATECAEELN